MKVDQIRAQMMNNPYMPTALLLSALDETACKRCVVIVYLIAAYMSTYQMI